MSKILVIYFSKYGTTKQYAEWIAEELNGDIYSIKNIKQNILDNYNTIIIGFGLYAGKMEGINLLVKYYETIKNKKLVLFTCGLADYNKDEHINSIYKRIKNELPEKLIEKIKIFYLRGGINYKKLTIIHKIMMWMLKNVTIKKEIDKLNEEDQLFIETYGKTIYFMDKKNIMKIIEYCK